MRQDAYRAARLMALESFEALQPVAQVVQVLIRVDPLNKQILWRINVDGLGTHMPPVPMGLDELALMDIVRKLVEKTPQSAWSPEDGLPQDVPGTYWFQAGQSARGAA